MLSGEEARRATKTNGWTGCPPVFGSTVRSCGFQEIYNLFMNGLGLQRASVTQPFCFDELRLFPDSGNCAAVFDRRNIIRNIMEHQCRNINLWGESFICDRLQNINSKLFSKQRAEAIHDFVRQ